MLRADGTSRRPGIGLAAGLTISSAVGLTIASPAAWAVDDCQQLIERNDARLDAMRRHAASIEEGVRALNQALQRAEQRNAEQTRLIERLQAELRSLRVDAPDVRARQRREFFLLLRERLPVSALYEVQPDRLIVASDPVFVFGKGEIGAEGEARLTPMVDSLRETVDALPPHLPWRLRIEGHSDRRPLRANRRFPTNWELSAARAVSMLRFLVRQGLPEARLAAVGLAATQLRDPGEGASSHRRNRRIEIYLTFAALPAD